MLEGAVQRGTGRKLKDLNLDLAGKTGTTNENTDAWFVGFTSNLVVGVYVGFDEPKSLGRYETGAKTALPIFKVFIKNAVRKKDARPFKVAKNIKMMVVDLITGKKSNFGSEKTIIEVFKKNRLENISFEGKDDLQYKVDKNNILKFY
jgi:penicillin-binding protein 1A